MRELRDGGGACFRGWGAPGEATCDVTGPGTVSTRPVPVVWQGVLLDVVAVTKLLCGRTVACSPCVSVVDQ